MNCYLTLDYELFMGKQSGTVDKCLIEPMKAFDEVLSIYGGVKATIFVDCAYLLRLLELKDSNPTLKIDYEKVVSNIKWLVDRGHSIQYHFHPQWLYSNYDITDNKWNLDLDHYKLSDMEDQILWECFHKGLELLKSITGKPVYPKSVIRPD